MDYSLLLVVETFPKTGKQAYHFGIIDFLQTWNFSKKLERIWKISVNRGIKSKLSAVPPKQYQARFMNFVKEAIMTQM